MLRQDHRIARLPMPRSVDSSCSIAPCKAQACRCISRIKAPASAQIGWCTVPFILASSDGVDIHHDLVRGTREAFGSVSGQDTVQPRSDRQQKIAVLDDEVRSAWSDIAGPADKVLMPFGDEIDGQPSGFDGNTQQLDQRAKFRFGARQADAISR